MAFFLRITLVFAFFASTQAYAWDPVWTLRVKVKGSKKAETFHPGKNEFQVKGVGSAQCKLSSTATATGSASRVVECRKGSVKKSKSLGFSRKMTSSQEFEFFFSGKEKGEPDIILELHCCTKKQ